MEHDKNGGDEGETRPPPPLHSSSSTRRSKRGRDWASQHSQEIPRAVSLKDGAQKVGQLRKLSGKRAFSSGTWTPRHCLLAQTRLYFFEREESDGVEKSAGFVNLDYFDNCWDKNHHKDNNTDNKEKRKKKKRKENHVFVIGASDKGFFETNSGRHYFAADSDAEMKEWVTAINSAMNKIRGPKDKQQQKLRDKSPLSTTTNNTKTKSENGSRMTGTKSKSTDIDSIQEVIGTLPRPSSTRLDCAVTKSRVKGPPGRRLPRKPSHNHQSPSLASSSSSGRKKVKAVVEKSDDDDDCLDELEDDDKETEGNKRGEEEENIRGGRATSLSVSGSDNVKMNGGGGGEENNNSSQKSSGSGSGTGNNNNSNSNHNSEKKSIGMVRSSRVTERGENWRNSRSMDFHDPLMDKPFANNHAMTYRYSSSSDESLNIVEDNGNFGGGGGGSSSQSKKMDFDSFTSANKSIPPRTPIFRGSTIRHSSVTPPPCVLRRMRRDYSATSTPRSSKDLDDSIILDSFMPEIGSGARRTSSGSSLSTLTAEPHNGFSRHISFSSLQREPKTHHRHPIVGSEGLMSCASSSNSTNLYQSINNGSISRGSSSANASPLMTSHHHSGGGHFRNHLTHSHVASHNLGHSSGGGGGGGGGGSGGSHSSARSSPLERNIQTIKSDLGAVVLETRQLDVDVNSLRQDVGSVQENIATVRGALDMTRERVGRLSSQVVNIERQISVIVKEANLMREQAAKLLEEAETSKASHEHLQEEAENMLSFLRQMAASSSSGSCHQNQGGGRNNHYCKSPYPHQHCTGHATTKSMTLGPGGSSSSNGGGCGHVGSKGYFPQPTPRMRCTKSGGNNKAPERMLDEEEEDEDEDEEEDEQQQRSGSVVKFSDNCKGNSSSCDIGTKRNSGCDFSLELTETGSKKTFSNGHGGGEEILHHGKDDSSEISLLAEI